ncbi:MAG: M6 family metalloprotease domain-containing protein [Muribaculaceae bacterium]|nr:M6 family metalloprotease domain-containing protein [Muribaculaceae bacterium]
MNIKRIALCALSGITCLSMMAVPARRGVRTFQQPDGSYVSLQLIGDEHFHSYATVDGLAAEKADDGFFYLRSAEGRSDIKVSSIQPGSNIDLTKFGVKKFINDSQNSIKARKAARKSQSAKAHKRQVPSVGSPKIPIILVQYKDVKFKDSDPKATFTNFFSKGDKSAYQYFVDQSNGKYTPQFEVFGPYTLPGNRSTYGGNEYDFWGNSVDKAVGKMVAEGCNGLNSQINFADYDNDGDGECDVVVVLYAGDGEASSYDDDAENAVWPCQWTLAESDYGKSLTLDGTKVDKFAVFNELYGLDLNKIDGIGTFCHEFSHCIDLPDFYDTQYGPHFGMGHWSLMDYGSYNDDGFTPIGYSAYEKEFMGWIEIEEAKENTKYNLPVLNQKNIATDKAVKITNPKDKNEYYIIENRANQGWDKFMPAEGLMIYHVTYDENIWINNTVNDEDMQRMTPIPADNSLKMDKENYYGEIYYNINEEDLKGDLWPWNGNNELTDTSKPAAKVNTGGLMGKPVTEITRNNDGTISFWTMKAALPPVATPSNIAHSVTSATSAVVSWEAVAGDVSYTLEVKPHRDIKYTLVSSTDFATEASTWSTENYTNVEDGAIRLGSSKNGGAVISPAFNSDEQGIVTVVADAKAWSNDNSNLIVKAVNASGTVLDTQSFSLTSSYEEYTAVLNVPASSSVKIRIEAKAKARLFLSNVDIYNGDASDISPLVKAPADEATRTITGITTNSYEITGLTEGGKYDYRVKAVPNDSDAMSDSPWSPTSIIDLSDTTAIDAIVEEGDVEIFTLQGLRLNSLPSERGFYIVRSNGKSHKVLVK